MKQGYSDDCDYLRERFKLPETTNLYDLVRVVTDYIRKEDDVEKIKEVREQVKEQISEQTKEEPISKEKKRGRPRKVK